MTWSEVYEQIKDLEDRVQLLQDLVDKLSIENARLRKGGDTHGQEHHNK